MYQRRSPTPLALGAVRRERVWREETPSAGGAGRRGTFAGHRRLREHARQRRRRRGGRSGGLGSHRRQRRRTGHGRRRRQRSRRAWLYSTPGMPALLRGLRYRSLELWPRRLLAMRLHLRATLQRTLSERAHGAARVRRSGAERRLCQPGAYLFRLRERVLRSRAVRLPRPRAAVRAGLPALLAVLRGGCARLLPARPRERDQLSVRLRGEPGRALRAPVQCLHGLLGRHACVRLRRRRARRREQLPRAVASSRRLRQRHAPRRRQLAELARGTSNGSALPEPHCDGGQE